MARFGRFRKPKSPLKECSSSTKKATRDIPRDKPAPLQIGPFRLDKNLGIGSFGKVNLAAHQHTKLKVAIKIIAKKKVAELKMHDKVQREINILQPLRHDNIMRLHGVIDTPSDIFLVNEYVSGGELFDYMVAKGRLKPDESRWFFRQIVAGVEYCHEHRVVHRDLKPENVLLDDSFRIKIADFGLSNVLRDGDFLKSSCGSPNYAAPEVIRGHYYAGPEVDLWSCGVVLYALLCGSLPFDDEEIPKLFRKIKSGQFRYPNHLSSSARNLISGMLNVDPMARFGIDDVKKHEWLQANDQSPKQARGGSSQVTTKQQQPRGTDSLKQVDKSDPATRQCLSDHSSDSQKENRDSGNTIHPEDLEESSPHDSKLRKKLATLDIEEPSSSVHKKRPNETRNQGSAIVLQKRNVAETDNSLAFPNKYLDGDEESSSRSNVLQMSSIPGNFFAPQVGGEEYHHRKWYCGIQSRKPPAQVMTQVYQALLTSDCQWLQLGPYRVKCKWHSNGSHHEQHVVKCILRLYKEPRHLYVLDFQQVLGDPISFMTLCSNIIHALKGSSSQSRTIEKNIYQGQDEIPKQQQQLAPTPPPSHKTISHISPAAQVNNRQE